MLIDEDSTNSTTFSLYTAKEIEQRNCIKQIDLILEKYNILENDNQLTHRAKHTVLFFL